MPPGTAIIGRPPKGEASLTKDRVLAAALDILDTGGPKALSFRALAKRLDVTPMAIAHHVGTRHDLLTDLIARVYESVGDAPEDGTAEDRLRFLLIRYCRRVVEHPHVAQLIFADRSLFAGQVVKLTEAIRDNVAALAHGAGEADILVDLIIDYTHGFAISAAAGSGDDAPTIDDFRRGLDWILARIL